MTEIDVFHPVVGASPPPPGPPGAVEGLQAAGGLDMAPPPGDLAAASALMDASMAAHTIRAYARDWRAWTAYAGAHHLEPLPAEPAHVCAFLAAYSHGRKATTTQRAAMAIGKAHGLAGLANPIDHEHVRRTLAGLRRTKGTAPRQAAPLCTTDIERLVAVAGDDRRGRRDRALILVGYVGAFRRSELAALNAGDLEARPEGLLVRIRRSKVDQDGHGRHKTSPTPSNARALRGARRTGLATSGRDLLDTAEQPPAPIELRRAMATIDRTLTTYIDHARLGTAA